MGVLKWVFKASIIASVTNVTVLSFVCVCVCFCLFVLFSYRRVCFEVDNSLKVSLYVM